MPQVASTAVEATEGLIFAGGDPGAWDEAAVGTPVVRRFHACAVMMCGAGRQWELWIGKQVQGLHGR